MLRTVMSAAAGCKAIRAPHNALAGWSRALMESEQGGFTAFGGRFCRSVGNNNNNNNNEDILALLGGWHGYWV
jgi:hypothetical protein